METLQRFYLQTPVEYSVAGEGQPQIGTLSGYATKFNTPSRNRGGYRDIFRPGVFGDSVNGTDGFDVKGLFNHDHDGYLARTNNNTLRLAMDDIGLKFSMDLPNTTLGRDTAELVKRGDVSGMSFGYFPEEFNWLDEDDCEDLPLCEHTAGTLVEVSVVFQPAIPATELSLSSLTDPPATILESLAAWKADQAGMPRTNFAARCLRIFDATA